MRARKRPVSEDEAAEAGGKLFFYGIFVIGCYATAMTVSLFGWIGPAVALAMVGLATSVLALAQLLLARLGRDA